MTRTTKKFSEEIKNRTAYAIENAASVHAFKMEQDRMENEACVAAFKKDEAARKLSAARKLCDERRWAAQEHAKLLRKSIPQDRKMYAIHLKDRAHKQYVADTKKAAVKAKHYEWANKRKHANARMMKGRGKGWKKKFAFIGPRNIPEHLRVHRNDGEVALMDLDEDGEDMWGGSRKRTRLDFDEE